MKILIVYFSGVGNTKSVSELMNSYYDEISTEIYSIEKLPNSLSVGDYSAIIIGTPTYHSEPALPIMKFLKNLNLSKEIPAFIFTTCGLYSENCLRILAKECLNQKIIPIHYASYRCSATDGMLLTPFMDCWFKDEKNLQMKIKNDLNIFLNKLKSNSKSDIPKSKWYAPLNYPNKLLGKFTTFPIYFHKSRCLKCDKCVRECPKNAISKVDDYLIINKSDCMNCYRCIHHCPNSALSLFKNKVVKRVWKNRN